MTPTVSVRGLSVPAFFYGTAWKEERTEELTRLAIASGFRAIDTANQRRHYVESAVGAALGGAPRGELFVQTKYTYARGQDQRLPYDPDAGIAEQVRQSFASSLEHLGSDVLDSYLLHGPSNPYRLGAADWEAWHAMEALHEAGRARLLGVSNVSLEQLVALTEGARVAPAFVQNRCFARTGWDRAVRAFCRERGIVYQGFSLLTANARELSAPPIARIADRHGRSVPQVVFRFATQQGMIPLTGTSNAEHMRQDLACFEFELSEQELRQIETIAG